MEVMDMGMHDTKERAHQALVEAMLSGAPVLILEKE